MGKLFFVLFLFYGFKGCFFGFDDIFFAERF